MSSSRSLSLFIAGGLRYHTGQFLQLIPGIAIMIVIWLAGHVNWLTLIAALIAGIAASEWIEKQRLAGKVDDRTDTKTTERKSYFKSPRLALVASLAVIASSVGILSTLRPLRGNNVPSDIYGTQHDLVEFVDDIEAASSTEKLIFQKEVS